MKKILLLTVVLTGLAGCGIGGMWMNGIPPSKMEPYVPPRDFWTAGDLNLERRESDWIECGGDGRGTVTAYNHVTNTRKHNELTRVLHKDVERCMLKKGYRYMGECSHSNTLDWPACGAP